VVNALAGASVSDQRERSGGRSRTTQAFSESAVHNVAHSLIPLRSAEFRLPEEIVIYDEGGSHTYDHIYAEPLASRLDGSLIPVLFVFYSCRIS